jgi:hypothetical protein
MSAPPAPAPKQPAAPPPAPRRATDSMPPMPGMEPRP